MVFFKFKHFKNIFLIISFSILIGCQFQEPYKNHGIVYLKNRSEKIVVNQSNKNDIIRIIGNPHSKSINNDNSWIYIERVISKGQFHKLGQNVLKENNVLVLTFDKYGVLKDKMFLDKNDLKKISFSKDKTDNELTQKSFVEKFLSSIRRKCMQMEKNN